MPPTIAAALTKMAIFLPRPILLFRVKAMTPVLDVLPYSMPPRTEESDGPFQRRIKIVRGCQVPSPGGP
ncbi:hypothetical protein T261_0141 [Streptomyces lydicus]|nr:hypothetical protein T261_0141 [Streptomyces lydicus]